MMSETTLGDKILVTKSYLFIVNQAVALFAQTWNLELLLTFDKVYNF